MLLRSQMCHGAPEGREGFRPLPVKRCLPLLATPFSVILELVCEPTHAGVHFVRVWVPLARTLPQMDETDFDSRQCPQNSRGCRRPGTSAQAGRPLV